MLITAIDTCTLMDYPGKPAAIIFTGGCNMRCRYCHNPQFVLPEQLQQQKKDAIPFDAVKGFLQTRRGLLEAVVFCGGEPTIQPDLLERMQEVKNMGFCVKLDTNGTNPETVQQALERGIVDYIAMDLKSDEEGYNELTMLPGGFSKVQETIALMRSSSIEIEFRSTIIPAHHDLQRLKNMAVLIKKAPLWVLQNFRNGQTLDPEWSSKRSFHELEFRVLRHELKEYVKKLEVRV